MNSTLTNNWNNIVTPDDTVYIIGDFLMGPRQRTKEFADRLNGHKILIIGNHDKRKYCIEAFEEVLDYKFIEYDGHSLLLVHDPEMAPDIIKQSEHEVYDVLCGHVHEKWKHKQVNGIVYVNVGVDVREFRPVTIERLIETTLEDMSNGKS